MTPEEHAKAIEDAAQAYADACIDYEAENLQDFSNAVQKAREAMQSAIRAGVGADHSVDANKMVAAPDGWQLVPVEPTNAMLDALEEGGCSEGNCKAALAAAPKP